MKKLTEAQLYKARDMGMSEPIPLRKADLTQSFVYARDYGVFYVLPCHHQQTMALLYAWDNGQECPYRWETKRLHGLNPHLYNADVSDMADYWVDGQQFCAYKSSVGKKIQLGGCGRPTVPEI